MKMIRWVKTIPLRAKTLFNGAVVERELDEEIRFHLEAEVARMVEGGMGEGEARRIAMKAMKMERQMEQCREVRAWHWLEVLRADVLFGWRQLMKRKITTLAAVLSLGLAMGACVGAFRLVDALFLRPMPAVQDPASLYSITYTRAATPYLSSNFDTNSYPFFEHARDVVKGDAEVAAASNVSRMDVTYGTDAETEKARRQSVSGDLFSMFGMKPTLGRLLTEDDDRVVNASPYAVISYDYWQRRFGRDSKVIGRTFRMAGTVFEIVGVGPKGFTGTEPGTVTDIFVPGRMDPGLLYMNSFNMRVFVRVRRGVSVKALADKLNATYQQWEAVRLKDFPKNVLVPNATLLLKPAASGSSQMQGEYALALTALSVLVAMVLLIACTNVANLMSAQAAARGREMALRVSIGAGRWRLVQMVMVESAMLGVMAACAGLAFAGWATPLVVGHINPPDNPAMLVLPMDWPVVAFGFLLAVGVTVLFGLLPALRASAAQPVNALKGGEGRQSKRRLMYALIAAQVAFCFVVLFLGGLFVATEAKLVQRPLGFVPERLLLLDTVTRTEQPAVKWEQMAAALRNVPGVQQTALEEWSLMSGTQHNNQISVNSEPPGPTLAFFLAVSPGWLDTMRIGLLEGRDFRDSDEMQNVALVNESFVQAFFGGRNPVGQTFDVAQPFTASKSTPNVRYQVIGVTKDVMYRSVREQSLPQVYLPVHRSSTAAVRALPTMREQVIVVRTTSDDADQMADELRRQVTAVDPEFRVSTVTQQAELISNQTIRERLLATLALFFAGVALLLAVIGLYGVLSYSVAQREREIGVRIALGAPVGNIARLVTVRVFAMVALGAVVGMALGVASVQYVKALLYGVKGNDPAMMALPVAVLLSAALLAALPAVVRAARIDPVILLRAE